MESQPPPPARRGPSPTIRDVAALAGVSVTSVSYVLGAAPSARIGAATRARILEAAAQLKYRPNAIAKAMVSGRTHTVGVYEPHAEESALANDWSVEVMRGIAEELRRHHTHLLLYSCDNATEADPDLFLDARVDGLLVLAPHLTDRLALQVSGAGLPTVLVGGRPTGGPLLGWVDADNEAGARNAVEHLIANGHRVIAHLRGTVGSSNAADRERGYEAALRAAGLPVVPDLVADADFAEPDGYRAMVQLLARSPRPTAVFACNDPAAIGALRACSDHGRRVPDDVAIVGFDGNRLGEFTQPALTTVRQPMEHLGREAAAMLLALVSQGADAAVKRRVLPCTVVVRGSSGPPTHED